MSPRMFATGRGRSSSVALIGLLMLIAFVFAPRITWAHAGGGLELTVSPTDIAAGDTVTVSGEGFTPNVTMALHLTGPNGNAHFGDVTVDAAGGFVLKVAIPGDVVPGLYLIRTTGDREASTELSVGAMAGMPTQATEAAVERDRSSTWKIVAVVILLGVAGLGAAIGRPRHRAAASPRAT